MKKLFMLILSLLCIVGSKQTIQAAINSKIGGTPIEKFTIVYNEDLEEEESTGVAQEIRSNWASELGLVIPACASRDFKKGKSISLIHSKEMKTFEYSISIVKGNVVIDGGSYWAMLQGSRVLRDALKKGNVPTSYKAKGTAEGEYLFPCREGVNLRILDDNIWDYSHDEIPEAWKEAGIDCRDKARAPEFAQLIRAYMADVVTLQEYSRHMHKEFYPLIQKYGYQIAYDKEEEPWNNTPIFYRPEDLELLSVNYNLYTPEQWSNKGSKSFCSAVFKQKATGKTFAVITTHLWWKSESAQKGSNYARASQVSLIMAEAELIKTKYNCPIFVTGDMNCEENTLPMQQFIKAGYQPCYKVATFFGNKDNGHHICSPKEVGERTSRRKSPKRELGAIDHCFIYNGQQTEIKIFGCIQTYFTVKLTDHYPNYIDAVLK